MVSDMSQETNPQYNYSDPYLSALGPRSSTSSLHQWAQQRSVAPEHSSARARSNGDTFSRRAPSTSRSASSFNYPHSNPPHRSGQIDPSLHLLNVPHPSPSRNRVDILPQNPIQRFYITTDDAWTPERSLGSFNTSTAPPRDSNFPSQPGPNLDYLRYRNPPGSEIESNSTAPFHSDSGYGTAPATRSISSIEPVDYSQDVPGVSMQLGNIDFTARTSDSADLSRLIRSDRSDQLKIRPSHRKAQKCPHCEEIPKCPSDYKKHILKHEKPYRCEIRGCRRGPKGFTTVNDLNRHKKSVHRIGSTTKSYQCASEHCRNKEKIWPRLDNFKQHVQRMHSEENASELIRLSEYHGRQPSSSPTPQPMSVAPMDTTLAGMEKHPHLSIPPFSNSGNLCLTPDNNSRPWENLEISPHDFDMDGNHREASPDMFAPGSQQADLGMNAGYRPTDQGQSTGLGSSTPSSWRSDATSPNVSLGLNALAAVACSAPPQSSPESAASNKPFQRLPTLSGEPQTKAEQQKRAFGHLTRVIAANISGNPKSEELDKAVWRVLSRATGWEVKDSGSARPSNEANGISSNQRPTPESKMTKDASNDIEGIRDTITRTEVLKGIAELAKLIKQKGKKTSAAGNRQRPFTNPEMCNVCDKAVLRRCDLRKHMKRHTRPYGCTFPKCKKNFGSKNDWKRHENSQHFQLEAWRCQLLGPDQTCCAELFYRKEMFGEHLKDKHGVIDPDQVTQETKKRRIGRNGQGQFWCGFCKAIVPLERKRSAAWDERFNHIDVHFSKESKKIDEWLCLEAKKTKGEVLKEMDKNNFDEDDEVGNEDCNNDTSPPDSQSSSTQQSSPGEAISPLMISEEQASSSSNPRKRQRSAEPSTALSRQGKKEMLSFCCQCSLGPFANKLYNCCIGCEHEFCVSCPRKLFINDENSLDLDILSYNI